MAFQRLENLATAISEIIVILRNDTSKQILSAMVTPLFTIGSAAREGDEQNSLREVVSSPQLLDPLMIHRERILSILEVIWSTRQTASAFVWQDCVELTKNNFLI
jgi:hypothetical protein